MSGWQRKRKYKEGKRRTRKEREVQGRKKKENREGKYLASGGEEREGKGYKYLAKKKEEIFGDGNYLDAGGKKGMEKEREGTYLGEGKIVSNERRKGGKTSKAL